jgi:two-component system, NtrC family, sensor kinase
MDWEALRDPLPGRSDPVAEPPRPPPRPRWRHATRRRLFLALSMFALAFVLALVFEVWQLHRIDRTLGGSRDNEVKARRALELLSAVRSQYAHQAHFVVGDSAHLAGERDARARVHELTRTLIEAADDPVERRLTQEIREEGDQLDEQFMRVIVPAVMEHSPETMLLHDKSYVHVAVLETKADQLFEHLQGEISGFRDEVRRLEGGTLTWTLVLIGIAPLFAAAVALYIGRSVTRPLALLGEEAARVASGDLDARIELDTEDEFGVLAAQFNAMTGALKENQVRLVMSEKLAGIGRLAAGFAHEINNPLSVVLGYVVRHQGQATGQLARDLDVAEQEILRCKEVVQELLEMARPPATMPAPPVDVRALCDEVVETLRSSGNLDVADVSVGGAGLVLGHGAKLRQVTVNLLKNAAQAAGPSGRIDVRVAVAEPWLEITVADDGPGIPPDVRSRLFEPFFTTKPDGTGLGLAVSRSIARAHGGDIEVAPSEKGAVFKVRLPSPEARGQVG